MTDGKKSFFINAYLAPPPPMKENGFSDEVRKKGFATLKNGNFTHVMGFYEKAGINDEEVGKSAEIAKSAGLKYLVNYAFAGRNFEDEKFARSVRRFAPITDGAVLFDEPGIKQFPALEKELRIYDAEKRSDGFAYVNLPSAENPPWFLSNGMWTERDDSADCDFDEYLSEFFALGFDYVSYDDYPFFDDAPLKNGYLKQLATVSARSRERGVPFFPYIQSCSWQKGVRTPNFAEVLWQCGVSVAFGAGGVQYFCFFTPYSNGENRRAVAMLDFDGNPTERFFAASTFNGFLKRIEADYFSLSHEKTVLLSAVGKNACAVKKNASGDAKKPFDDGRSKAISALSMVSDGVMIEREAEFCKVKVASDAAFVGFFSQKNGGKEQNEKFALFLSNAFFDRETEAIIENSGKNVCKMSDFCGTTIVKKDRFSVKLGKGESAFLFFSGN